MGGEAMPGSGGRLWRRGSRTELAPTSACPARTHSHAQACSAGACGSYVDQMFNPKVNRPDVTMISRWYPLNALSDDP